jgi:hypothetical protein
VDCNAVTSPSFAALLTWIYQIAKPSQANVSPLHHQETRGRRINLTEYPRLHLVWYYDRIFIKPIPQYMLTQVFWDFIREADQEVFKAALGFMRTYYFLIQHEADFRKAKESYLIPKVEGRADLTFEDFAQFIQQFEWVENSSVTPRYHYGNLQLPRLNPLAFFVLGKLSYFHVHGPWSEWFERTFGPIIAIFAVISVMLSAMQVGLSAADPDSSLGLSVYAKSSWIVSILVLVLVAVVSALTLLLRLGILFRKQLFAMRTMNANRRDVIRAKRMTTTAIR